MFYLQARWQLEGKNLIYYGLRNEENLFKNKYRLNKKQQNIIRALPCALSETERKALGPLVGVQVVPEEHRKAVPKNLEEAVFCKNCAANDYIIAGLEFDKDGLCPICQTKLKTAALKSVTPIKNTFPKSKKSRFDVALFYTGGKDSTYLLYYLSKVLQLRVLALTWEIPYISESARLSIANAKKALQQVEFITRYISNADLKAIYRRLYSLSGNTCACPSLAYVLFYPELVANKVPYFIAGNEPAQLLGLYYNHMAPKLAYTFADNKALHLMVNLGRLLTLHPPLKKGQFHTLATMKTLAYGGSRLQKLSGYANPLVSNVVEAIHTVPQMAAPLKRAISASSWTGNIPAFVQVDLNEVCGGKYDWNSIKDVITKECGWVAPAQADKGLHTSCKIEKCKEHSQFVNFYNMKSTMIPFSALEISIASRDRNLTKAQAMDEIKNTLGFSLTEIPECAVMKEYFEQ